MTAVDPALQALLELTRPLASERRGDVLDGALEHIGRAVRCQQVIAFAMKRDELEVAGEHQRTGRASSWQGDAALAERIRHTASRACKTRKLVWDSPMPSQHGAQAPARLSHVLTAPVLHRRQALGALVVVLDERDARSEAVLELSANVLGLAFEVARAEEREIELRAELVGAGRMASLGVLLTTLAHELQGPVNALTVQMDERRGLLSRLAVLAARGGEPSTIVSELTVLASEMDLAVARLSGTVSRILSLGRRDSAPDVFDVSEPARDAIELCRADFARRGVTISQTFEDGATVRGRRDELGQVVMNLLRNAADACEGHAPHARVSVQTGAEPNRVVLSIEDNGPGVTRSAAEKIFETFYTTKPRGKGTGLGLKICRDVVSGHGGHIEVSSTPGAGALFRVFLPRAVSAEFHKPDAAARARTRPELPPTRPELKQAVAQKILLVEDDDILTRALKRALRPHEVRIAPSAEEASAALAEAGYEPDVVLCDLNLPGIPGDELHRRLAAERADLARKFVFVTGGAFSEEQSKYLRECGCPTLLKPVSVNDVIALLARDPEADGEIHDSIPTLKADDG